MSLRCDVICALAYGGGHESSHIVKAHADFALWEFLGSHGFNEIQRDDYLWEFVADYLEHRLHGLYGYVGLLNLVESV